MKGKSILLALSGSQQSRQATEVCWRLARQLGATITAHHVVDSHSAWEFLGHDNPGFLSSSLYLEAYQVLLSDLFKLGERLADSYAADARDAGVDNVCLIDEGNPITEICRRAANHKLVVIGHRGATTSRPRSQFQRLSVAEALAHDCPRPLLVVQSDCSSWTSLAIMISLDHINEVYINSCLDMAEALGLKPALLCLTGGAHEEKTEDFVHNIRRENPRLEDVTIAMAPAQKDISVSIENCYGPDNDTQKFDPDFWRNTLIVIPTRMVAGERLTVVDSSPSLFVRYLSLPAILLWPEEYSFAHASSESIQREEPALVAVG
jgi:nucleotide-binding universal stress UspA family protein